MEALHGLLPHSASHKIIDSREKADPEDEDEAPDPEGSAMQDLMDVDPWFRHACLRAEHGDKTCVSQNMAKLIPRPSRSSDVVPGVLAKARKIEVKKKAIRELHHTFNVKLDQEKALSSAIDFLLCPECINYRVDYFQDAAVAIAGVFAVDDALTRELFHRNDEDTDHRSWTFVTRIAQIEKLVAKWGEQKAKKTTNRSQPELDDVGRRFSGLKSNLDQYRLMLRKFEIGKYASLALKYGAVTLYSFFKWCSKQQEQQELFISKFHDRYAKICKVWKRHPDTPTEPKSWPPPAPPAPPEEQE